MKQPLYQQILNDLKADITAGTYLPEDKLPTELELAERYGVSRITSKRALVELENEGMIYRLRGKGSFVCAKDGLTEEKTVAKTDILFIMPFPHNAGLGDYTQGMLRCLEETSYRLQVQPHQYLSSTDVAEIVAQYAGIIYYPTNNSSDLELLYGLHLNALPTVLLDKEFESLPFSAVVADNQQGGFEATQHLIAQGHQQVAFVSTEHLGEVSSVRERYFGYMKALHAAGATQPIHLKKTGTEEVSVYLEQVTRQLLDQGITGVIAENDIIAIQLINTMKQMGYQVPADFAVVGFDNIQAASLLEPSLTTISQKFEEMGTIASQTLLAEISQPTQVKEKHIVPVELIVRKSSQIESGG